MKLQQAYVSGFERKVHRAYGLTLQPLTLGHVQLLAELGCPIGWGLTDLKKHDIATIVAVGTFALWEQAREYLVNNPDQVKALATRIALQFNEDEASNVLGYVVYYMAMPRRNDAKADPEESRVPWWWSYAEFLQSEMGRSESDAWNTICSDAFAYFAAYAIRNGSKDFMNSREVWLAEQVESGKTMKQLFEEGLL